MASLEIEGKIVSKLAIQKGTSQRGEWARQDFVLEYMEGSYPSNVCFSVWGVDKVDELAKYQVGDTVKVSFNIKAREYDGRWYNDIRVWRMGAASGSGSVSGQAPASGAAVGFGPASGQTSGAGSASGFGPGSGQTSGAASASQAPAPGIEDIPSDNGSDDDLPF